MLDKNINELKTLISSNEINNKLKTLGELINSDYGINKDLYIISVLKGSSMFCCDLIKYLEMPILLEFIRVSSYGEAQHSSGVVNAIDLTLPNLDNKNVLVVDDIFDTGNSYKFIHDFLKNKYTNVNIRLATLLYKTGTSKVSEAYNPNYYGFHIEDKFVVGYGLDYKGYFRNLPYVAFFE